MEKHSSDWEAVMDEQLTSLYKTETPATFESAWRASVQRGERSQMKTKHMKKSPRFTWRAALPAFAALVLVVGTLAVGSFDGSLPMGMDNAFSPQMMSRKTESNEIFYDDAFTLAAAPMAEPPPNADWAYEADAGAGDGGASTGGAAAATERKIVRSVSLSLATSAFEQGEAALRRKVADAGGYIEHLSQWGDGSQGNLRSLYMTLRIPSEKLDAFLGGLGDVGRVSSRSESSEDKTIEYSDSALYLENQRLKMARLQELVGQADTITDILEIEGEIFETQAQIDRYEKALRSIDRDVERSAVDISLNEEGPAESAAAVQISLGQRLTSAFRVALQGIGQFFRNMLVFLVMASPVLLLLAVLWLVAVVVRRRRRRHVTAESANETLTTETNTTHEEDEKK